jgi:hypothetical protein
MRLVTSFTVLSLASWGAGIRAQGIGFGRPSLPSGQPTFRIKEFSPALAVPRLLTRTFNSSSDIVVHGHSLNTCPMPVARGDFSGDTMPVAKGGTPEPMPVAKSGCWNSLDPQP